MCKIDFDIFGCETINSKSTIFTAEPNTCLVVFCLYLLRVILDGGLQIVVVVTLLTTWANAVSCEDL